MDQVDLQEMRKHLFIIGVFREGFAEDVVNRIVTISSRSCFSLCDFLQQDYLFLFFERTNVIWRQRRRALRKGILPVSLRNAVQSLVVNNLYEGAFVLASLRRFPHVRPILICTTPMVTILGILLRRVGLIDKVVYWSIDWFPSSGSAFEGSVPRLLMSTFMQRLDRYCYEHSDRAWDVTDGITSAREQRWGGNLKQERHSIIYPVSRQGVTEVPAPVRPFGIVFVGRDYYFTEGGELWSVVGAVKQLRERGIPAYLEIFGGAKSLTPRQLKFMEFVKSIGANEFVTLHGYMAFDDMCKIIARGACGVALFSGARISNFAFSGKVLNYLENGIPVIMTANSALSSLIKDNNAGVVIDTPDKESISVAIAKVIQNQATYREGVRAVLRKDLTGDALLADLMSL
jgi:glycosyltransferase involved in cell wall biosynthesis